MKTIKYIGLLLLSILGAFFFLKKSPNTENNETKDAVSKLDQKVSQNDLFLAKENEIREKTKKAIQDEQNKTPSIQDTVDYFNNRSSN